MKVPLQKTPYRKINFHDVFRKKKKQKKRTNRFNRKYPASGWEIYIYISGQIINKRHTHSCSIELTKSILFSGQLRKASYFQVSYEKRLIFRSVTKSILFSGQLRKASYFQVSYEKHLIFRSVTKSILFSGQFTIQCQDLHNSIGSLLVCLRYVSCHLSSMLEDTLLIYNERKH